MLVYASELFFKSDPAPELFPALWNWLHAETAGEFRLRRKQPPWDSRSSNGCAWAEATQIGFPSYSAFCTYSVSEPATHGRRWITEIGIDHPAPESPWRVSILFQVDDISPMTQENPIFACRPGVVDHLLQSGSLSPETAGIAPIFWGADNAQTWRSVVRDKQRTHAAFLISPDNRSPTSVIDPAALQSLLLGIAQIHVIDSLDTLEAWSRELPGIIAPRPGAMMLAPPNRSRNIRLLTREYIREIGHGRLSIHDCLFHEVLHATNRPLEIRHLTPRRVRIRISEQRLAATTPNSWKAGTEMRNLLKEYQGEIVALHALLDGESPGSGFSVAAE